jgi:hypothetical protein
MIFSSTSFLLDVTLARFEILGKAIVVSKPAQAGRSWELEMKARQPLKKTGSEDPRHCLWQCIATLTGDDGAAIARRLVIEIHTEHFGTRRPLPAASIIRSSVKSWAWPAQKRSLNQLSEPHDDVRA